MTETNNKLSQCSTVCSNDMCGYLNFFLTRAHLHQTNIRKSKHISSLSYCTAHTFVCTLLVTLMLPFIVEFFHVLFRAARPVHTLSFCPLQLSCRYEPLLRLACVFLVTHLARALLHFLHLRTSSCLIVHTISHSPLVLKREMSFKVQQ